MQKPVWFIMNKWAVWFPRSVAGLMNEPGHLHRHSKDKSPPMCMLTRASLIALLVKNPPTMQETLVRFLGREDPLEKG